MKNPFFKNTGPYNLSDLLIKIEDFDYKSIEFIDLRDSKKAIIRFYNNETIDLINNL